MKSSIVSSASLKLTYDRELSFIAEYDGEPAGLSLVLSDMNQALKKANGRLFPLGLLKILWHKRKIDSWRVPVLGVLEKYRMRGIEVVFCCRTYDAAKKKKHYRKCELSWILASDHQPRRAGTGIWFGLSCPMWHACTTSRSQLRVSFGFGGLNTCVVVPGP